MAQPHPEVFDQRSGAGLTLGQAPLGRGAADVGLDGVQLGDSAQPLGRDRGVVAVEDLTQLAPRVRPAKGEGERLVRPGGEPVVPAIGGRPARCR